MACSGCHILDQPQTDANRGLSAPIWATCANAEQRIESQTAEEYVHNSIVNTNAFIVTATCPTSCPKIPTHERRGDQRAVEWLDQPSTNYVLLCDRSYMHGADKRGD